MSSSKTNSYQSLACDKNSWQVTPAVNIKLVDEVAAAISINGIATAVMMVSPNDLKPFALGFALSEGFIEHATDVRDLEIHFPDNNALVTQLTIELTISPRMFRQFKQSQQVRLGASGCGLCGTESLAQAFPKLPALSACTDIAPSDLSQARSLLNQHQELAHTTGAIHAALLLSPQGEVIVCMEDIGRHNALDKVIGYALSNGLQLHDHSVIMSSRCSTELVQKAVKAKLSRLIHLASPSHQAVAMARHYGLVLIHLPKQDSPRLYAPINPFKDASR